MRYISTRTKDISYSFSEAVRLALAEDGGLIVPERFPEIDQSAWWGKTYPEIACEILKAFVPELDGDELKGLIDENYTGFPIPLVRTGQGNFLELFHGPTGAFKDVALTFLPKIDRLTSTGERIYVTATSGDTGKAALEAFRDQPGTKIMVFYPEEGVSPLQKLQMQTQAGDNVKVVAIRGNFDDAQRGVKALLREFSGKGVSSCNSINIARLLTQVPYYFHAASLMGTTGLDFHVPTGNFGDVLAGYYAGCMGLYPRSLVVATNENDVLSDFFNRGFYDRRRELKKTSSPSMDILVSSNLERLIFHKFGVEVTARVMRELEEDGFFRLDQEAFLEFSARTASEDEVKAAIRKVYEEEDYLMDPHTACAWVSWDKLGRSQNNVILATASPFKFPVVITEALTGKAMNEREALAYLSDLTPIHPALEGIFDRPIRHEGSIAPEAMREEFLKFAGGAL